MNKLLIFLFVFLVSCTPNNNKMLKDFNREGQVLQITVHVYKNQKNLLKATKKYNSTNQIGLAVWNNKDNNCDIFVIKPSGIKSNQDETWGHELRHCVYGTYHKEH